MTTEISGPLLRFEALCLDTTAERLDAVAAFWSDALGWAREPRTSGGAVLRGEAPGEELWVDVVPEALTVKHRTHLDVRVEDWHTLLDLGATVVDENLPWVWLRDPDGGDLCAFPVREGRPAGLYEVVTDTGPDGRATAQWWADVLGSQLATEEGDEPGWFVQPDGAPFEMWVFGPVPEPKTVKNRLHLDFRATRPDAVELLLERGATLLRAPDDDIRWHVLADPEGNELCVFPAEES